MAWEMVNYNCGHSERKQFYGHHTDRESKKEWLERGICPDCYRQQKEEERRIANENAKKENANAGLPALEGSEKQIAWAESIRKMALDSPKNTIASREAVPAEHLYFYDSVVAPAKAKLVGQTSAKWWIDNRSTVDSYVMACAQAADQLSQSNN